MRVLSPLGTMAEVKQVTVNFNTSGDHDLIAAVAGKTIAVLGFNLVCGGATTLTWKSKESAATIMPAQSFSATGGNETRPAGVFCTAALAETVVLNLGSSVQVSGPVDYIVY